MSMSPRLVSYKSASHGIVKGEIVPNRSGLFHVIRVTVTGNKFYRKGMEFRVPRNSENLSAR